MLATRVPLKTPVALEASVSVAGVGPEVTLKDAVEPAVVPGWETLIPLWVAVEPLVTVRVAVTEPSVSSVRGETVSTAARPTRVQLEFPV